MGTKIHFKVRIKYVLNVLCILTHYDDKQTLGLGFNELFSSKIQHYIYRAKYTIQPKANIIVWKLLKKLRYFFITKEETAFHQKKNQI